MKQYLKSYCGSLYNFSHIPQLSHIGLPGIGPISGGGYTNCFVEGVILGGSGSARSPLKDSFKGDVDVGIDIDVDIVDMELDDWET